VTMDSEFDLAGAHLDEIGAIPGIMTFGNWSVFGYGTFDSMDDALDPLGADSDLYFSLPSLSRGFQFTP